MEKLIKLSNSLNFYNTENNKINFVGPLCRLNILVGVNNSGKSRFMRNIFSNEENALYSLKKYFNSTTFNDNIELLIKNVGTTIYGPSFLSNPNYIELKNTIDCLSNTQQILYLYDFINSNIPDDKKELFKEEIYYILSNPKFFEKKLLSTIDFKYIPILRGIDNFNNYFAKNDILNSISMTASQSEALDNYVNQSSIIYSNKISKDYGISNKKVFTGEKMYEDVVNILLGDESERDLFHEFEKFMSDNFYDGEGFEIHANNKNDKKCLMVKIKKDKEYEIYNLGDGIKQLIIILYIAYINKNNECIFYIEEPEINLHPGFQRKLMEILLSDTFKNHIFFINTHSNHIVDIVNDYDDVSLLKFNKIDNKCIVKKINSNDISILNDLGIRSSSIFLSNCTIWVEGISDRIYLKKYLNLYFEKENIENKYKENINYSFVEYQGNNITHWNFGEEDIENNKISVNWLSHNTFLIVDNDDSDSKPNSEKNKRYKLLEQIMGKYFYKLSCREIENLISLPILEEMLKKDNKLTNLERKKYNTPQTIHMYSQERITNTKTYLGEFIEDTYILNHRYRTDVSKTVKNKAEFAKKICAEITKWDDLTLEAQNLTETIAKFIIDNN